MATPVLVSKTNRFSTSREHVLSGEWASGLSSSEVTDYLATLDDTRFASVQYRKKHDHPLIQPRGGFATYSQQKLLVESLEKAGADFIPLTVDSFTRNNDYARAGYLLQKSEEEDKNYLNGYPLINHSYMVSRGLFDSTTKPVCLRHGTPDARLLAEVALASGVTEIEGGGLVYSLPYSAQFPVDKALLYWQYVDQLCSQYSSPGRPIHRESFGPLTATMVPPFMVIVVQILELLMAAEQGIKSFGIGFGQTGSFVQDIATNIVLRNLSEKYLGLFDFKDVEIRLVYHQWMGSFPTKSHQAGALITASAIVAEIIRADKIVVKTRDEAVGIPTIEENCRAVEQVRFTFEKFPVSVDLSSEEISREVELVTSEVEYVLETIFNLKGEAFWESIFHSFKLGFLDIPYSPHQMNANKLVTIRDSNLAIRIQDPGRVPIQRRDLEIERQLLRDNPDHPASLFDKMIKDVNIMV